MCQSPKKMPGKWAAKKADAQAFNRRNTVHVHNLHTFILRHTHFWVETSVWTSVGSGRSSCVMAAVRLNLTAFIFTSSEPLAAGRFALGEADGVCVASSTEDSIIQGTLVISCWLMHR